MTGTIKHSIAAKWWRMAARTFARRLNRAHTRTRCHNTATHTHAGKGSGNTHTETHTHPNARRMCSLFAQSVCGPARTAHNTTWPHYSRVRRENDTHHNSHIISRWMRGCVPNTHKTLTTFQPRPNSWGAVRRLLPPAHMRALSIGPSRRRPAALILCGCCW